MGKIYRGRHNPHLDVSEQEVDGLLAEYLELRPPSWPT